MSSAHLRYTLAVAVLLAGAGCSARPAQSQQSIPGIEYRNKQYDFCFSLPSSWKGYSVVTDQWEGFNQNGPKGYQVVEHGPLISIRHPLWTTENPRQDIPIMVFTRTQWDSLQKDDFHIGAAPIGPSDLGENGKYVFALPARYNFGDLPGFEEVAQIIQGKPLHGSCKTH
jgi:hypothetical protein